MFQQQMSHGNILSFTPPGFSQVLNVKFPDSRLAVCEKCKKNYKTRDMCRVRNSHTSAPWTTAYICITLDESCLENGEYVDTPFSVRMVPWQPYCVKECFDAKTPVCAACKKTNRTRSFCRTRHQHKALPWCTVYVVLSASDSKTASTATSKDPTAKFRTPIKAEKPPQKKTDDTSATKTNQTKNTDASSKTGEAEEKTKVKEENDVVKVHPDGKDEKSPEKVADESTKTSSNKKPKNSSSKNDSGKEGDKGKTKDDEDTEVGDDIHEIATSKTFLAKVSCRNTSIHWLEISDYDANAAGMTTMIHPDTNVSYDPTKAVTQNVTNGYDPTQYYAQMSALGYPNITQQQQMQMQQQHFLQMQQRQHFAAQQAAWQQYNQHVMSMNGQMMSHPGMAMMNPMAMQAAQQAPATAARPEETKKDATQNPATPQGTPATLQAQAQAQWQAQMMYQQQLYHQQFQMQQHMAAQQHQMMAQQASGMYFAGQQPGGAATTPAKPIKEEQSEMSAAKRQKTAEI